MGLAKRVSVNDRPGYPNDTRSELPIPDAFFDSGPFSPRHGGTGGKFRAALFARRQQLMFVPPVSITSTLELPRSRAFHIRAPGFYEVMVFVVHRQGSSGFCTPPGLVCPPLA